jgi:uncharacterized protein
MICTFECTFCKHCVENILENVCPNCTGGFTSRPVRPKKHLEKYPVSYKIVYKPVDLLKHKELVQKMKNVRPEER